MKTQKWCREHCLLWLLRRGSSQQATGVCFVFMARLPASSRSPCCWLISNGWTVRNIQSWFQIIAQIIVSHFLIRSRLILRMTLNDFKCFFRPLSKILLWKSSGILMRINFCCRLKHFLGVCLKKCPVRRAVYSFTSNIQNILCLKTIIVLTS